MQADRRRAAPSSSSRTVFPPCAATDRIITIERGRLVEDGTHDELIAPAGAMPRCTGSRRES